MGPDSHPDRIEVRYPFTANILVDAKVMVKGIDISMGGLYVYTGRVFPRGKIVDLSIPEYNFNIKARIQHSQAGVGMGLKFLASDVATKKKLLLLLRSLDSFGDTAVPDHSRTVKPGVLLIDSNDSVRRINKSKLSMEGMTVYEASDAAGAINMLKEHDVNLIVCEHPLGGMDTFKLLGMIRSTTEWRAIPVIMLSAVSSSDMIDKVYEAGADEFLSKSTTSPAKLAERVKNIISKER